VDAVVQGVARRWRLEDGSYTSTQKVKILQVTRIMYHLREGALLDGPSSSPMSAYILRTMLLKASFSHGLRIMIPALRIVSAVTFGRLTKTEDDGETIDESLDYIALSGLKLDVIATPPETTSLFPGTCAVLDAGDLMVVRTNPPWIVEDSALSFSPLDTDRLMQQLEQFVRRLARGRYPLPTVLLLPSPGTPQDRFLYARLSPSHLDTSEQIVADSQLLIPSLRRIIRWKDADLSELRRRAPVTDQPSFSRYLLLTLPVKHTSNLFVQVPSKSYVTRVVSAKMERDSASPISRTSCLEQLESNSALTHVERTTSMTGGGLRNDAPQTALLDFILGANPAPRSDSDPQHSSIETIRLNDLSLSEVV